MSTVTSKPSLLGSSGSILVLIWMTLALMTWLLTKPVPLASKVATLSTAGGRRDPELVNLKVGREKKALPNRNSRKSSN